MLPCNTKILTNYAHSYMPYHTLLSCVSLTLISNLYPSDPWPTSQAIAYCPWIYIYSNFESFLLLHRMEEKVYRTKFCPLSGFSLENVFQESLMKLLSMAVHLWSVPLYRADLLSRLGLFFFYHSPKVSPMHVQVERNLCKSYMT